MVLTRKNIIITKNIACFGICFIADCEYIKIFHIFTKKNHKIEFKQTLPCKNSKNYKHHNFVKKTRNKIFKFLEVFGHGLSYYKKNAKNWTYLAFI